MKFNQSLICFFKDRGIYRDIVFLADSSDPVNWPLVQSFSKAIVDSFDVSPKGTHFAYVVYSDAASRVAAFPQIAVGADYTAEDVKDIIDNIPRERGLQRNVIKAIPLVSETFKEAYGGRKNAKKVIYIRHLE